MISLLPGREEGVEKTPVACEMRRERLSDKETIGVPLSSSDSYKISLQKKKLLTITKEEKRVALLEMSGPWISNRYLKDKGKAMKYAPLRYELGKQLPGYRVQCTATQYCG